MSREHLFTAFFFVVLVFLLNEAYRVFSFFLGAFAWAAVFTLALFPLYRWVLARVRSATLAALLMTLFVFTLFIGPVGTLGSVAISQGQTFYETISEKAASGEARAWLESARQSRLGKLVDRLVPGAAAKQLDLGDLGVESVKRVTAYLVGQIGEVAKNIFSFLFNFLVMQVMLFFFFRDGRKLYFAFRDLLPMEREHKDAIFGRLYETLSAVVQGMVFTSVLQGVAAGFAFWFLDLPFWLFLGVGSSVASFVPVGGAALVWVPSMMYFFTQGLWGRGFALLAWGVLVISLVDNVVRPLVIGSRTNISTLFLFFGILGGLQAYGPIGIFIGPVLLATMVVVLRIYREDYAEGTIEELPIGTVKPHPSVAVPAPPAPPLA
jgi:predicted PurR-regulated permease PerM